MAPQLTVERTVFVSGTGTDQENCASLRSVLDNIPDPRTLANAYLVKLGPGRYSCGDNTVSVPIAVAVEGAGTMVTVIIGDRDSDSLGIFDFDDAFDAELRFLTVANLSDTGSAIAVSVFNSFVRLSNVDLYSSQSEGAVALWVGVGPGALSSAADVWNARVDGAKTKVLPGGTSAVINFFSTEVGGAPPDTSEGGAAFCSVSFSCGTPFCSVGPSPSVLLDSTCSPP